MQTRAIFLVRRQTHKLLEVGRFGVLGRVWPSCLGWGAACGVWPGMTASGIGSRFHEHGILRAVNEGMEANVPGRGGGMGSCDLALAVKFF